MRGTTIPHSTPLQSHRRRPHPLALCRAEQEALRVCHRPVCLGSTSEWRRLWRETCIAYMVLALVEGGGEERLRRRHGPGQGTGRLRAIAVAREAAGGMRGGRVACGFPSGGGKGESRRGCSFFCSCWVLLILWSQVFFPSGGPEQVQRGWRAGASYYCCCWGSLRCVFPASGDRVCVCDVGRALSAPVEPWSEQARGLGSAHGRVQGLRIGWVEGMSHRPRGESVLLLAGVRGGGLGVEGRKGLRLGRTTSSLLGTVCREPVV